MDAPILLIVDSGYRANPFGPYLGEILKTEGFSAFRQTELREVDVAYLRRFPLVLLAEVRLDDERRAMLREYVRGGGRLLAMRPDPALSDLFGLAYLRPRPERLLQYVGVAAESDPGRGIESGALQYHGEADEYRLDSAEPVAWLYEDVSTPLAFPAAALNRYGEGMALAFSYDLARSVALTRQGNPAWACGPERCEDGDGVEGIRPVDGFMRQSGEQWVGTTRMVVPQADEQQRLLGNCIETLGDGAMPLPRLCYLPEGKKAVLVVTGDGDNVGFDAFDDVMRTAEEYGGRFTAYVLGLSGDPAPAQVEDWLARGHEVAVHIDDTAEATRPTLEGMARAYDSSTKRFVELYGRPPGPSMRHHWLIWYGWAETAEIAHRNGVRVDFNFYHGRQWRLPDGSFAQGYYTGSGLPQRFVTEDGRILDIFQVLTEWADETQQRRRQLGVEGATRIVREMLDAAERGRYTVFVANFHPSVWREWRADEWARNMMQEAVRRGMPIWSGADLYRFVAARDAAHFSDFSWDGSELRFTLDAGPDDVGLTFMVPASSGRSVLAMVSCQGEPLPLLRERIAGRDHGLVRAVPGEAAYRVIYSSCRPAD